MRGVWGMASLMLVLMTAPSVSVAHAQDCRIDSVPDPNSLGVPSIVCPFQAVSMAVQDSPWCCLGRPPRDSV